MTQNQISDWKLDDWSGKRDCLRKLELPWSWHGWPLTECQLYHSFPTRPPATLPSREVASEPRICHQPPIWSTAYIRNLSECPARSAHSVCIVVSSNCTGELDGKRRRTITGHDMSPRPSSNIRHPQTWSCIRPSPTSTLMSPRIGPWPSSKPQVS